MNTQHSPPRAPQLASGLRALAEETTDRQLRRSVKALAAAIESGQPLPVAVAGLPDPPPAYLVTLLAAADEQGGYSLTLAQVVAAQERARRIWRSAVQTLLYPLVLLVASVGLLAVLGWEVVTPLVEMVRDLELKLPVQVERLQWTAQWGGGLALVVLLGSALIAVGTRVLGGQRGWSWLVSHVPLAGLTYHWAGVVEWLDLVRLLIVSGAPLPRSLREAGAGLNDRYVGAASERIGSLVEQGLPLSLAVARDGRLPTTLVPFLRSGEAGISLPAALKNAADLFAGRLQLRSQWLERSVPAVVIVTVALLIAWVVTAVYAPLIYLMHGLGGGPGPTPSGPVMGDPLRLGILAIPGLALVIARRVLQRGQSLVGPDVDRILAAAGWVLLGSAGLGLLVGAIGGAAVLPIIIGTAVMIEAYAHFRQCEHRALLLTLAAAVDYRVPLPDALLALADERGGSLTPVARRLAEQLQAGRSLTDAIRGAKLWLPVDLRAAVAWAERTGLLRDVLNAALRDERSSTREYRKVVNSMWYPVLVAAVGCVVLTFIMLKIMPVYSAIFRQFSVKPPRATTWLIDFSNLAMQFFPPLLLLFVVGMFVIAVLLLDTNMTISSQWFPPLRRIAQRQFGAQTLYLLAVGLRRGFPLADGLKALAEVHPVGFVCARLARCLVDAEAGRSAWPAFRQQGLVGATEAGVLAAAQRAGNLPWAMEEMADGILRRRLYRLRAWYNVLVPLMVLLLGGAVAFVVIAMFVPLIAVIQGAAPR